MVNILLFIVELFKINWKKRIHLTASGYHLLLISHTEGICVKVLKVFFNLNVRIWILPFSIKVEWSTLCFLKVTIWFLPSATYAVSVGYTLLIGSHNVTRVAPVSNLSSSEESGWTVVFETRWSPVTCKGNEMTESWINHIDMLCCYIQTNTSIRIS